MKNVSIDKRKDINIGNYIHHNQCRFCYTKNIKKFIDFGNVPLAGGFFPKNSTNKAFNNEKLYPLEVYFCPNCYLVQSNNTIPPKILFKKYFYFSSTISSLVKHFEKYTKDLMRLTSNPKKTTVLEIGCNDGVFLKPLKNNGFNVIGVEPATNVVQPLINKGFNIYNTFFTERTAKRIKKENGKVDIVLGTSSLAHIDNMHDILRGVKTLLKDDGVFIVEEHYLGNLIDEHQYDMIYHEHPSYYSLLSLNEFLEMYDMEVFMAKYSTLRAGLMRYYIQNKVSGKRRVSKSVTNLLEVEKRKGYDKLSTYRAYYKNIKITRKNLMSVIKELKSKDKTIVGYGASGRATIIMSFCGITRDHIDYMVDDAPTRQDIYMPGNHVPVRSSTILDNPEKRPNYAIVFAWPFIDEIRKRKKGYLKSGGKFIIPLPKVKIIGK